MEMEEEEEPLDETASNSSRADDARPPFAESSAVGDKQPAEPDLPAPPKEDQPPADESILDANTGDQPTPEDRLGFAPYVRAMAAFLTNPLTRPPLTLSVEGEWGCGKSSFMLQLESALQSKKEIVRRHAFRTIRQRPVIQGLRAMKLRWLWKPAARYHLQKVSILTIWFNAWWHDKEDALWAAFALEFLNKLSKQLSWPRRVWAWLKLWALRFKWQDGWFDLLQLVAGLLIFTFISFACWKVYRSNHNFAETLTKDKGLEDIISALLKAGGITAYTIFAVYLLTKLKGAFGNPLAINLRQHLDAPNYQSRVAFIEQFQQDFSRIVRTYAGQNKVFVFIDDLDRCEVPKAADLMQALNMMIASSPQLIFIVGMDREKVAAGLAVKYEKVLPYLTSAPAVKPSSDKSAPDPTVGLEYGYTFIEKFIQLPFQMPYPDLSDLKGYLDEINHPITPIAQSDGWVVKAWGRLTRAKPNQTLAQAQTPLATVTGREAALASHVAQSTANSPVTPTTGTSPLTEAQRKRRETIRLAVSKDSDRVRNIALMIAPVLDNNPRRIKQFINLFRLRTMIVNETGLFDILENEPQAQRLTLEKLGKFVAISLRWPLLLADLDENPKMLDQMQRFATNTYPNVPSDTWHSLLETDAARRWSERRGLIRLLSKGLFLETPSIVPSPEAWRYSLVGLDVRRLLKVSPPVPRAKAKQAEVNDKFEPPQEFLVPLGNGVTLGMISISGNTFLMGGTGDKMEGPQHRVRVPSFSIGKYPVTQAQWQAVMGKNLSHFKGENNPVDSVSWEDARSFCQKLSELTGQPFRLPTEAEWEYACRAGTTTEYSFGDDQKLLEQYAWYIENADDQTHPVGQKKPNGWGLYDMHGNVLEWCQDVWHEDYDGAPDDGSAWTSGGDQSLRILRNGTMDNTDFGCRSAARKYRRSHVWAKNVGFRVVTSARTQALFLSAERNKTENDIDQSYVPTS